MMRLALPLPLLISLKAAERELKTRNLQTLGSLIRDLNITVSTRWRAAHDMILSSPDFRSNPDLEKVETLDILAVYDDYSRLLEREHEEESRKAKTDNVRRLRKARDGFKALLTELQSKGELTRSSKWKETLPKIRDDERYITLLGLPGSSPLDLWMDAVDDLGEETVRAAEKIEKALSQVGKSITVDTKEEELEEWLKEVHLDTQIEAHVRKDVYLYVRFVFSFLLSFSSSCRCV